MLVCNMINVNKTVDWLKQSSYDTVIKSVTALQASYCL